LILLQLRKMWRSKCVPAKRGFPICKPINKLFCQDKWIVSMTRDGISLIELSVRAPGPFPGSGRHAALDRLETLEATVIQPEQGEPLHTAAVAVGKQPAASNRSSRKALLVGASLINLAGAAHFGWQDRTVGGLETSTDDAYVRADNTTIVPTVLVGDNERAGAGQAPPALTNTTSGLRSIGLRPMSRPHGPRL
jgi:hypothetical protein